MRTLQEAQHCVGGDRDGHQLLVGKYGARYNHTCVSSSQRYTLKGVFAPLSAVFSCSEAGFIVFAFL